MTVRKPSSPSEPCNSTHHCKLCKNMSNKSIIQNVHTGKLCHTAGGTCSTTNTIYAAECTKHSLIYVGHTGRKLSQRFVNHRSDALHKPKACELAAHFHQNDCNITKDLKVYILETHIEGTLENREFVEDKWITRLDTRSPNGLNSNLRDFGQLYYTIFNK